MIKNLTTSLIGAALLLHGASALAAAELGSLTCSRIKGTGVNLILTSSAQVRCIFKGSSNSEQWYIGETGVKLGIDLKFGGEETINLAVVSTTSNFVPEGAFLSGKYRGGKADAAFGLGIGAAVLLGGSSDTIALQPAIETSTGAAGISAGIGFLDITPDPLNQARIVTPRGGMYEQALYAGYFDLAFGRYHETPSDYTGSDYFSERAIATANGAVPEPERSSTWALDGESQRTADAARERLLKALQRNPGMDLEAAMAQISYDCWLFALAKGVSEKVTSCAEGFEIAVNAIETAVAELDLEVEVMRPLRLRVLFDTDVSKLDGNEEIAFVALAERLRFLSNATVHVTGYADHPGTRDYNLELSKQRAKAVRGAIAEAGVPATWISSEAFGEDYPLPNNPYDALNRRVDVVVNPLVINEEAVKAEVLRRRAQAAGQ